MAAPFNEHDVVAAVSLLEDRDMRPADARRQLVAHMEHGLVEHVGHDTYRVADLAVRRYGFGAKKAAEAVASANENGEAEASPETGSDDGDAAPSDPHPQPSPGQAHEKGASHVANRPVSGEPVA